MITFYAQLQFEDPPASERRYSRLEQSEMWREAQFQLMARHPDQAQAVLSVKQPIIQQRSGTWYDFEIGNSLYGVTEFEHSSGEYEITVGIVTEEQENFDTITHEYKHFLVDSVDDMLKTQFGKTDHLWIDGYAR